MIKPSPLSKGELYDLDSLMMPVQVKEEIRIGSQRKRQFTHAKKF